MRMRMRAGAPAVRTPRQRETLTQIKRSVAAILARRLFWTPTAAHGVKAEDDSPVRDIVAQPWLGASPE